MVSIKGFAVMRLGIDLGVKDGASYFHGMNLEVKEISTRPNCDACNDNYDSDNKYLHTS